MAEPARSEPPEVSVLIVNWNAGALLRRCLESLPAACQDLSFEAIVVDNGSEDGSLEGLPEADWLRLRPLGENLGFAAANNRAAAEARGRRLLLLNPDTECSPGSIRRLVEILDAGQGIAAVGPGLVHPDGSPQRSAWRGFPGLLPALVDALYLWKLPALPFVRRMELRPDPEVRPVAVDHLLGACMLIPRAAWEQVGALDEGYFLFLEETDWCRRAGRAGLRLLYAPEARVLHHGQQSVRRAPWLASPSYYRGYLRFLRRDGAGPARLLALRAIFVLAILLRLGLWSLRALGPRRALARRMLVGYGRSLALVVTP